MVSKKQAEARYIDMLRCDLKDFPSGTLVECAGPDFLIHTLHDTLGVEVTQIFQATKQGEPQSQAQESERQHIVQQAKQLCIESQLPPVVVSVHFSAYPAIAKTDRHALSKKIAEVVSNHVPREGELVSVEHSRASAKLPNQVHSINILRLSQQSRHIWTVPTAGYVQTDFVGELQSILVQKGGLVSKYLRKCDRCWLLIVAAGNAASSLFEPSAETRQHVYRSSFDRIFYLEGFGRVIVELTTERSPNSMQTSGKRRKRADA